MLASEAKLCLTNLEQKKMTLSNLSIFLQILRLESNSIENKCAKGDKNSIAIVISIDFYSQ